jgi:hypothetical protein
MGVKITGAAAAKAKITKRKPPVKKPQKATRSRVWKSADSGEIGSAILALTATMTASMAASKAETDAAIRSVSAEVATTIEAMRQSQEETNLELRRTTQELSEKLHKTTQELSEKLHETNLELRRTTQELSEKLHETTLELRHTTQELSEKLHKTTQELSESIHDIDSNVGGVNRRLGKVVELVVLPGLMEKMNREYNYRFDNVAPNKKFTADGQLYAEMDLFFENGESVMAVEAKTRLTEGMVNAFVNKLELLRQHETKAGLVGKTIYAAIAGIIFDDNAKKSALEKGIYLVGIDRNNDKIKIEKPVRVAGEW